MSSQFQKAAQEFAKPNLFAYFASERLLFIHRDNNAQPLQLSAIFEDERDDIEIDPETGEERRVMRMEVAVATQDLLAGGVSLVNNRTQVDTVHHRYTLFYQERNETFTRLTLQRVALTRFNQVEGDPGVGSI